MVDDGRLYDTGFGRDQMGPGLGDGRDEARYGSATHAHLVIFPANENALLTFHIVIWKFCMNSN